uniref:Uncharacterized protein n=1 Tax=Arundo donax TaxID=35708 RepID=A0A0A9FYC1_ARUDO
MASAAHSLSSVRDTSGSVPRRHGCKRGSTKMPGRLAFKEIGALL